MGGEPGDRQLGLPGPLVGFMPQSIRLVGSYLDSLVGSSLECLVGSSMEWLVGWLVGSLASWTSRWVYATVNPVGWFLHGGVGPSQGPRPPESEFVEATPLLEALEQVIGLQWSSLQHSYETSAVYILSAQALPFCHP